eukprot:s855_g12.t1
MKIRCSSFARKADAAAKQSVGAANAQPVLNEAAVLKFLGRVKLFQRLPKDRPTGHNLPALQQCVPAEYKPKARIICQGDDGDEFFIIQAGEADVEVNGKKVATLKANDYFGENALLRNEPRTATITAKTDLKALKIGRDRFDLLGLREKLEFPQRKAVGGGGKQARISACAIIPLPSVDKLHFTTHPIPSVLQVAPKAQMRMHRAFGLLLVDENTTMLGDDDYTIVTNAHVVRGSGIVRVQFPSLGRHLFDATVPMICFQFDLAIVKLKDPTELREKLKLANVTLSLLKLQARNVKMGMRVAALGFPLGSQWLKLSEGVVSGAEVVEDNMVYQSTAPISPGNSGGPLLVFRSDSLVRSANFDAEGRKPTLDTVVGVNFASSASKSAQNLNYAVPAFRIVQVLADACPVS